MNWNDLMDEFTNPANTYQTLTVERVVIALAVTFLVALFIFFIYRVTFKGVLYTRNFNVGLVLTSLVTALVILPISSNIALSLGMVGALSIVRFRAAIKDPTDIIFTFWAIAVGITCGAGLYMIAIVGCLMIGLFLIGLTRVNLKPSSPYLLVIHYNKEAEKKVQTGLPKHKVRSRTVNGSGIELMVEVRLRDKEVGTVDKFLKLKGVKDAALVSYNSDYSS